MKKPHSNVGTIKSMVTIMITATFCYLVVRQNVPVSTELLGNIFFSVITYFFAKQHTENKYRDWTPPNSTRSKSGKNPTKTQRNDTFAPEDYDELND